MVCDQNELLGLDSNYPCTYHNEFILIQCLHYSKYAHNMEYEYLSNLPYMVLPHQLQA